MKTHQGANWLHTWDVCPLEASIIAVNQHCWYIEAETKYRQIADDIFKCISLNENVRVSVKISLQVVPTVSINNIPALVQIMAWRRSGDKALSESMMISLPTHICVNQPQCVNSKYVNMCSVQLSNMLKDVYVAPTISSVIKPISQEVRIIITWPMVHLEAWINWPLYGRRIFLIHSTASQHLSQWCRTVLRCPCVDTSNCWSVVLMGCFYLCEIRFN